LLPNFLAFLPGEFCQLLQGHLTPYLLVPHPYGNGTRFHSKMADHPIAILDREFSLFTVIKVLLSSHAVFPSCPFAL